MRSYSLVGKGVTWNVNLCADVLCMTTLNLRRLSVQPFMPNDININPDMMLKPYPLRVHVVLFITTFHVKLC